MRRPTFRRNLRLESLESREVLSAGGPTADAQYMLEMINLARTNPQAASVKFTTNLDADVVATLNYYHVDLNQVRKDIANSTPRPPVAWNDTLAQAATGMATDQAVNGFQSHTGSNGSSLGDRLKQVNYNNASSAGENSYAYSKSVDHAMEAFLIDWGVSGNGHRNNLLQPSATSDQVYREVGIGIVPTQNSKVGPLVITQDFGTQSGSKAELLGVAFNDNAGTGQYQEGEGQGNVEIDATNASGKTVSTLTWDNGGGYQLSLDPGQYTVQAKVGGNVIKSDQVTIGTQNVQIDYNLSSINKTAAPTPAPVSVAAPTAPGNADTNNSFKESWDTWTVFGSGN